MRQIIRILGEGAAQAWQQLVANRLRSFLSLLGITIGIFCIIGVKSAVNSLEDNIRRSLSKLGNDVIYIDKFSWSEDPGQNFWKWMRRPNQSYREYEALKSRLKTASHVGYWQFLGAKTVKWRNSSVENAFFISVTEDCSDIFRLEFQEGGRFFSPNEYANGSDVCIIGAKIAETLFPGGMSAIDQQVKMGGRKLRVIGVTTPSGNDLLRIMDFDNAVMISHTLARRGFRIREGNMWVGKSTIAVRAKPNVSLSVLKDEITGIIRSARHLRPVEEDNFALNTLTILSNVFDSVFGVINAAGFIIGIFALLVGMFSVANIMFVSVKERTNIIGIKMAIGAKRWFILLEILFEATVLCLVGGALGLLFIWLATMAISNIVDFDIHLSAGNIAIGIFTSAIVGILSGLLPALQASRMDPVEAIRAL
ncbi:MAG: ABC transporter permease [Saprospiraceae bacterium]|nr:ABC transporter permease [Saprospiraceae bacterium]MDW8228516.1 ABC transporter permease [Saprospiraceae bacterium]